MKNLAINSVLLPVLIFTLAACAPAQPAAPTPLPAAPTPAPSNTPLPASTAPGLVAPPPLSFKAAVYRDEANGFELDYPAGWSLTPNAQIGSRGSSAQLFSPGASAETLPAGGTRVSVTIYQWDPKGNLAAYADHRKSAWEGSGTKVTSLPGGILADGRERVSFILQGPDLAKTFVQLTTLGESYLEIAGDGDLALSQEIANTLRPVNFQP